MLADVRWEVDKLNFSDLTGSHTIGEKEAEMKLKTLEYMQRFLALTDISHFPPPKRPDAAVFSVAEHDGYIPYRIAQARWENLVSTMWSKSKIYPMKGGHVSSILFRRQQFISSICDVVKVLEKDREIEANNKVA